MYLSIGDHERQSLGWILSRQRGIRTPRLEDAQHCHDEVDRAIQKDAHEAAGLDTAGQQSIGQPSSLRREFGIRQAMSVAGDGDRCRRSRRLRRKQLVERGIENPWARNCPQSDCRGLLPWARQRHPADRHIGVGRGRGEQGHHTVEHPRGRGSLEQVRGVFQAKLDSLTALHREQRHIEMRHAAVERQTLGLESRQPHHGIAFVLPGKHHLKHRRSYGIAASLQQFNHAVEGQVGMGEGPEHGGPDASEQLPERRVIRQVDTDGQCVDEAPDHGGRLAAGAVRHRRAHDHVFDVAPPGEDGGERRQQDHERGACFPLREHRQAVNDRRFERP